MPCDGDELVNRCIEDCRKVGLFGADDPVWTAAQCDLPNAYVVYEHARAEAVREIREWLAERNIILAGRYSEWEYYNSDHAFLAGNAQPKLCARLKRGRRRGNLKHRGWRKARARTKGRRNGGARERQAVMMVA